MISQEALLKDTPALTRHILSVLHEYNQRHRMFKEDVPFAAKTSAVLFLLGRRFEDERQSSEPCLILNKRSAMVKQAGDLCCPGGSISSHMDTFLSKMLYLPGSPLMRWPHWRQWVQLRNRESRSLAVLFAAALRESFEEMRLNPLGVNFLGPLPPQQLEMFRREIYPMVCWVPRQKKFFPNWEVEKLIYLPIRKLLNPSHYACCRLRSQIPRENWDNSSEKDFPCFVHDNSEQLWGATFRISMAFLDIVFGFKPPDFESLPVVRGTLDINYQTGKR